MAKNSRRGLFIICLILIIAAFLGFLGYYLYNNVYVAVFVPNNTVVPAFEEGGMNLVIEGSLIPTEYTPKVEDNEVLLPIDIIREYIDPYIYWDSNLKKVTITTSDRVIRMKTGSLDAFINDKPITLNMPATEENGTVYMPIYFLKDFYDIEVSYIIENNVIIIDFKNSLRQLAQPVSPGAVIRKGRSIRYPVLKKLDMDDGTEAENTLRIFEEYDKWYKVRAWDGVIGYIEKKSVVVKRVMVNKLPEKDIVIPPWTPGNGKINLVWEMMYSKMPELSKIGKMEGLDVISPTWFQLANANGKLINRAVPQYVEWAKKNGYKVWALFSNDFNDINMTEKFLNNTDFRDNAIREILAYSALYRLDGINIDFENVYKKDKGALTQFVREITPFLREQGLTVSVDVSIPDGSDTWSLCYDRKALGETVDYVALMAYDQHWASSPKAGSVAQFTWVENNIKKVLKEVPEEKLLLGMPFYTRVWLEEKDKNGNTKVSNPLVLSMDSAWKMARDNNAAVIWDEASGQSYAEFTKDGKTYKVWIEDEESINLKSSLVHKYRLAGTAAWRRSDETAGVWDVLNENLKVISTYQEWKLRNDQGSFARNN